MISTRASAATLHLPNYFRSDWRLKCVVFIVITGLLGMPLIVLLISSMRPPAALPFDDRGFSLVNFRSILESPRIPQILVNTFVYGAGTLFLGLSFGGTAAFLVERTNLPLRSLIYTLMVSVMVFPTMLKAFGWILLLSPGIGLVNIVLRPLLTMGETQGPLNVYSLSGMIWVSGLGISPSVFLMLGPVFRHMNPALEEAGYVSGSGKFVVLRYVTLPLMLPGLLSCIIYFAAVMVQSLETALAIGLPGGVRVLSTHIFLLTAAEEGGGRPQYSLGSAFGIILLVLSLALMLIYFRKTRQHNRFAVVVGRDFKPRQFQLGMLRYLGFVLVASILFLEFLPILMLGWASLLPFYQVPSIQALSFLTLNNFFRVLENTQVRNSVMNTIILLVCAPSVSVALAFFASWLSIRRRMEWVEAFAMAPIAIPHIVFALAVLLLYIWTPLHGTLAVLVIAYAVAWLPFVVRIASATLIQLHPELEEAARISGAASVRVMRRIIAPLILPGLINAWLYVFSHSAKDFTVAIFLMSTSNMVITAAMWALWNVPDVGGTAALAMLFLLAFAPVALAAHYFSGRDEATSSSPRRKE